MRKQTSITSTQITEVSEMLNRIASGVTEKAREYGLFNLKHIPGNLYHFFLATPLPVFADSLSHVLKFPYLKADPWGMGIFITSPIFIYLFPLSYIKFFFFHFFKNFF